MKVRRFLIKLILMIMVLLLGYSSYNLYLIYKDYRVSSQAKEKLLQMKEEDPIDGDPRDQEESFLTRLHADNPDCLAWITIEGTDIDYPVMYHPEEEAYYLRRNYYGEHDISGTPYIAENCDPEDCDNLIIYGHNMRNHTMFEELVDYKEEGFCKEHPEITLYTLYGVEKYQIAAVLTTQAYRESTFDYYSFTKAQTKADYEAYAKACKERSLYEIPVDINYREKLITLSTCEYSQKDGRMIIIGVLKE